MALGVHLDTMDAWLELPDDVCDAVVGAAYAAFSARGGGQRGAALTASVGFVLGPEGSYVDDGELKVSFGDSPRSSDWASG